MARFILIGDDHQKAFINIDLVCTFRYKQNSDGSLTLPAQVEIEFIGGGRTKLHDETAKHFLQAVGKFSLE